MTSHGATQGARSVLIAVDGSDNAKSAFRWYLKWSRRPDDFVTFLHVLEPPSLPAFSISNPSSLPTEEWGNILSVRVRAAQKLENDYTAEAQGAGLKFEYLSQPADKVGEAIIKQAEKQGAHLIIIGTRGLGAIQRTFLGSVSDYVLHQGVVPVTVVPTGV
ncbi:unnamed protein product [Dibothriocephalus latus]|uniref:UspA domain-containing protein n=1 Tax=Dibothriocephalus latus TaxID=60516 RepID=A0A3P7LV10_DIBLA|nr:unnamed protein product [Dibothriocephalus latus]